MLRLATTAGAVLAAGTAFAVPATGAAAACSTPPAQLGSLHLTKIDSANGKLGEADLTCFKGLDDLGRPYVTGTGTITDPVTACQELDATGGDLATLDVHPTWFVPDVHAPVAASASGTWAGLDVDWSRMFANAAELRKFTGAVFVF